MKVRTAQVEVIVFKMVDGQPLFLLLKRNPRRGGFWQPVTGGVHDGEELADAAKRELSEETQIDEYLRFIEDVHYFEFDSELYGRLKEYVFGVEVVRGVDIVISSEHTEMKWCTFEESLNLLKYDSNKEGFKKLYFNMTENIIIKDPKKLEEIKKAISEGGADKLHVISDFDRTLTYSSVDGERRPSLIFVLRSGGYLTPDYAEKAHALFDKYHPIEIDPNISVSEKKEAMQQWWQTHFDLLIRSGLNKNDIEKAVDSGKIKFRGGAREFFDSLHSNKIPLIVLSANGLGEYATSMFFEKNGELYNNIHIISNSFEWDEKGDMVGFREPIIHTMNKDETAIKNFPAIFQEVENRKNVLLLGDNLGDIGMIDGFDYDNLIKIGFLNENTEENLEQYKNNYDVVVLNDSSMDYVNELLKEITEK